MKQAELNKRQHPEITSGQFGALGETGETSGQGGGHNAPQSAAFVDPFHSKSNRTLNVLLRLTDAWSLSK